MLAISLNGKVKKTAHYIIAIRGSPFFSIANCWELISEKPKKRINPSKIRAHLPNWSSYLQGITLHAKRVDTHTKHETTHAKHMTTHAKRVTTHAKREDTHAKRVNTHAKHVSCIIRHRTLIISDIIEF